MHNYYFFERNGSKEGPFNIEDIKKGDIRADDLVWRSDGKEWRKASEFEELQALLYRNPPLTPAEKNIMELNSFFFQRVIQKLAIGYVIFSFLLGVASHTIAANSWKASQSGSSSGRYPVINIGYNNEDLYGSSQKSIFRPYKAFYSTIYLTKDEQQDTGKLLTNLLISSFLSTLLVFLTIGVAYYIYLRFFDGFKSD